jgi:hypothetical protein
LLTLSSKLKAKKKKVNNLLINKIKNEEEEEDKDNNSESDKDIDNYLNEKKDEVFDEDIFAWIQKTFQAFSRKNKNLSEEDFKNLQKSVIDNVDKLSKKSVIEKNTFKK